MSDAALEQEILSAEDEIESAAAQAATVRRGARGALQSAAVYAIGGAIPRAIGILTLPIYTRVVAPSQYGSFALLVTIANAVTIVMSVGLDVIAIRSYFQVSTEGGKRTHFINTLWVCLIVGPLAAALVIGAAVWPFIPSAARFTPTQLVLAFVGAALNVGANVVPLAVLRADQRLRAFLGFSAIATVSNSALSLLFVAGFRWGVTGWLLAAIVAYAITLYTGLRLVPFRRPKPFDFRLVASSVRSGLPLVPHQFSQWALQVVDRIVIAGIVSSAALGVYSLASNLGLPVLMLVQSINYGFMPTYARAGAGEASQEELDNTVVLHAASVALVCSGCALLAPPFVAMVAGASYAAAAPLIPWIVLGYGCLGLYCIPMNGMALGAGRTGPMPLFSGFGFLSNVALLYLMVPGGGIRAAAIAGTLAYALMFVAVAIWSRNPVNPLRYRWAPLIGVGVLVGATYVAARLTSAEAGGMTSLLMRTGWWLVAAFGIGALAVHDRKRVRQAGARSRREQVLLSAGGDQI